ncbi:MAG: DUF2807 domain-containing protein [Anaerolineaceae bacterium]|nr:DUF2807 domain-containing protein [Anaerolineaceae bacterium]
MAERKNEIRELGEFNRISMHGIGKITIDQGKEQKIAIEGDAEAIDSITTHVTDGKLIIDVGRDWVEKLSAGFNFILSHTINIHLTVKELEELEVAGAADVEIVDLKTKNFALKLIGASNVKVHDLSAGTLSAEIPGAGKIVVDGKVQDQSVKLAGAGSFSGLRLKSKTAKVAIKGFGKAQVWVTGELDVTIAGFGSVRYYGNPFIKQSITMFGKITSLGEVK